MLFQKDHIQKSQYEVLKLKDDDVDHLTTSLLPISKSYYCTVVAKRAKKKKKKKMQCLEDKNRCSGHQRLTEMSGSLQANSEKGKIVWTTDNTEVERD